MGATYTSNVYYQERLRKICVDTDENVFVSARFKNAQISFMGNTYYKRTDHGTATQILFAKINKDGQKLWAKVLGSTTSFENIIEHQIFNYWAIHDTTMVLTVPYMSYGSNKNIEWGDTLVPTVSIPGTIFDNVLVLSANTGDVVTYFNRGFESLIPIDSISYFGIRNDFEYFEAFKFTTKSNSISGTVYANGVPVTNTSYTNLELISVMPGETGTVKTWATLTQNGEFVFDNIPFGGEYIISVVPYDSTLMCGYYSKQGEAQWHQADTVKTEEQNDGLAVTIQKISYPTGTATIKGTLIIKSLQNQSIANISNVQVILRTQQKSTNIVAFTRASYDFMNMTETYSYEFKNVPIGDYIIEVLYPFATTVEPIALSVLQENQVFEDQDFEIIDDKVYKRYETIVESSLVLQNIRVIYNPTTQTINVTDFSANNSIIVSVYTSQGAKISQNLGDCSISIANMATGVYFVCVGTDWFKVIK